MKNRCAAVTTMLLLAGFAGCEEAAPPPMPASGSNPSATNAARQVRDMVQGTQAAIEQGQQRAVDAANQVASGQPAAESKSFGLAGVEFTVQPGWTARQPSNAMRKADLEFKGASGTVNAVFFTLGGTADDNINRWTRQIEPAPGEQIKTTSQQIGGFSVRRIDGRGTFTGMAADGTNTAARGGTRFIGVVIDGASGQIQVRLVGPEQAVNEAAASFDAMINAIKPSPK